MTLTHYGFKEWGTITLIAAAIAGGFVWAAMWWPVVATVVVWLALVAFFRDPRGRRPATDAPNDMVSPADGKVSAVFDVEHHAAIGGPAKVIRIFLSVLDVHINRFPCDGVIATVTNTPGKYLDARSAESAQVNESTVTTLTTASGEHIGIRQVSGAIARRIVCAAHIGSRAKRGARFGMIKFGSTTELILPRPADVTSHVSVGDRVTGGVTIIATLGAPRSL
ncbi:MAG: phosphatidylserine decarboxylase family protein [Planctomycetota bacterium]|nr:MAG: phosphatidylserine decarboxylase family protein [Planctomycetota bacterium]